MEWLKDVDLECKNLCKDVIMKKYILIFIIAVVFPVILFCMFFIGSNLNYSVFIKM
jgi:hypothetical protein